MAERVLKVITVWEPWASLIIIGAKPYEFRGWKAPASIHGQRIGIHAGARPVHHVEVHAIIKSLEDPATRWETCLKPTIALPFLKKLLENKDLAPRGHILGTAICGVPRHGDDIAKEFGGPVNDSDRHEHANWGWPLTDIEPWAPPVPAKGMQGLWNYNG